jgi:amidase
MFQKPSIAELREAAHGLGMHPSEDYLLAVDEIVAPLAKAYAALDGIADELPTVKYPRGPAHHPEPQENRYGAWYVRTSIKGEPDGKLAGRRVALKDNICLAGVPMMIGADILEGYVPEVDATVVERVLDAGGEIAGKAVCEYYCVSGGSHTSSTGPVQNPRKPGYSAGGSSSGSAALVAAGEVEMAIGGDQAGSIRIPASHCGIVGLKPTYGLVPYTGIAPLESRSTLRADDLGRRRECAVAGGHRRTGRIDCASAASCSALHRRSCGRCQRLRIAVLRRASSRKFGNRCGRPCPGGGAAVCKLGATVEEVSVPMHTLGFPIWAAIRGDAACITLLEMNGAGLAHEGLYIGSLMTAAMAWRKRADAFADTLKIASIFSKYTLTRYGGRYYAKAQNLRRRLRRAYDEALATHELLLMPTVPMKATPIPGKDATPQEITRRSWEGTRNTCPFNVSGHPAISVPCGLEDGRPIGMMLVGRHHGEETIYRAAAAFERCGDWTRF